MNSAFIFAIVYQGDAANAVSSKNDSEYLHTECLMYRPMFHPVVLYIPG